MTNFDRVLKTLLENRPEDQSVFDPYPTLLAACPDLSKPELEALLNEIAAGGLIRRFVSSGWTVKVMLYPSAFIYFKNQAEIEAQKKAEKLDDRRWALKVATLGYVAGFISGIASMWVKATFFP